MTEPNLCKILNRGAISTFTSMCGKQIFWVCISRCQIKHQ